MRREFVDVAHDFLQTFIRNDFLTAFQFADMMLAHSD